MNAALRKDLRDAGIRLAGGAAILLGLFAVGQCRHRWENGPTPSQDPPSRAVAEATLREVLPRWSRLALEARGGNVFVRAFRPEDVDARFAACARLGALRSIGALRGGSSSARIHRQFRRYARYAATARFTQGDAEVAVDLIMEDRRWVVSGFEVQARALDLAFRVPAR